MSKKVFRKEFFGRNLVVEVSEIAKQANGAAIIKYEDTTVMSVVAASKQASTLDFFPLMVMYNEKMYAAGKIPGGFLKREGRPSENATLTARLIDRPIRPLFEDGFRNEIQIINNVLSVNPNYSAEMTAMFGSSLVLAISDVPFKKPIAGVIVGRINGEFIINPTSEQLEKSDIDLTVAGTKEAINMVEAGAKQVSEKDMLDAIMFGHEAIKQLVEFQEEIVAVVGVEKMEVVLAAVEQRITDFVEKEAKEKMVAAIQIKDKLERYSAIDKVKEETLEVAEETHKDDEDLKDIIKQVKQALNNVEKDEVRRLITKEKVRPDGRSKDEVRALDSQIDTIPRVHGSAMFTRGQTQCLSFTTLGALNEYQIIDGLGLEDQKRFMLHYNFPQFSVGSTGRYGPPGRREVGHGALGERALAQVMPSIDEFPYTVRIVSEILESNGSTSQASICAGCMSLMAAGVPLKAPVAGIAMGLVSDGEDYTVLTDIQGMEDHLGDMDFKVAGTREGVTALQMDIKIEGISKAILEEALEQARIGRLQILENMESAIPAPREELSEYAPKIRTIMIKTDKIKEVIGRGGETITKIIEDCDNVKIDIEDDGRVIIYHTSYAAIDKAVKIIENIIREVEVGKIYTGKVVRIEKFGAFVQLWEGQDGMCHISKLAVERVNKVEDVVSIGDEIVVKCIKVDDRGRVDLSREAVLKGQQ